MRKTKMKIKKIFETIKYLYNNDSEISETFIHSSEILIDDSNDSSKHRNKEKLDGMLASHPESKTEKIILGSFNKLYAFLSVVICCFFICYLSIPILF